MVWLTGGALVLCVAMIAGLLALVAWQGVRTFWPRPIVELRLHDGTVVMGQVTRVETRWVTAADLGRLAPAAARRVRARLDARGRARVRRRLVRTGNFERTGEHFRWVDDDAVASETRPPQGLVLERLSWGRFYGVPVALRRDDRVVADSPRAVIDALRHVPHGGPGGDAEGAADWTIEMRTAAGDVVPVALADVVRAVPANALSTVGRLRVYGSRWKEFLTAEPREANSEGGVWPAIVGTVVMTLLMSLAVVPLGVCAALYLREYARAGLAVSAVRIAINNLAGVPSIVFGVFGLGFFCYIVGGSVDRWFFADRLPNPTFGTGGVLWASLTLALLTLPVVVVATEEALAAVPRSMREGSYACGASRWQTIRRIVLPHAMPGIMTGLILAMARGAGEVAPLMLVGAVKLAPALPVDGVAPFLHLQRSFMHLGFHVFDVGFQSQNSEAARPMVYTSTLLLITIIATLNLSAIWLRARLRRRFVGAKF